MKKKSSLLFVLLICFISLLTSCGKVKWNGSLSEAKKLSVKQGKDILMVISGGAESSEEFKENVLDSKDFIKEASKNFVLLFINLSADDLKNLSQEDLEKVYEENSKIIMDYNITEELTLLRLTSDGYWIDEFPYAEKYMDPAVLLEDLNASDEKTADIKEIISSIKKSAGTNRAAEIDKLYEYTHENYRAPLMDLCYEIPDLDKSNNTGLLGKYELIISYDKANKILSPETVDQAAAVFTNIAEQGHLDRSQKFEAYFTAAYLYPLVGSTNFDQMYALLQKAYDINPNDPHASEATDLMQNIKDMKLIYEESLRQSEQKESEEAEH